MLSKEDLQAIAELMDVKLSQQKQDIMQDVQQEIQKSEKRVMQGTAELVDEKIQESEKRIMQNVQQEIKESEKRIMQGAAALIDAEVRPMFNSLADEVSIIREKVESFESVDTLQDDIFALKAVVKQHTREINQLKKAQ